MINLDEESVGSVTIAERRLAVNCGGWFDHLTSTNSSAFREGQAEVSFTFFNVELRSRPDPFITSSRNFVCQLMQFKSFDFAMEEEVVS